MVIVRSVDIVGKSRKSVKYTVEIALREGPVFIDSLAGAGVDKSYSLWNGITASEYFPPNAGSAYYVLSLRKPVSQPDEALVVEGELVEALKLLATAFVFSGGSRMVVEVRDVVVSDKFRSNAQGVRSELLAARGERLVSKSMSAVYEVFARYRQPPLEVATIVAKAAMKDFGLRRLLEYHQAALVGYYHRPGDERNSWFIDLHKVRETLSKIYRKKEEKAIIKLNIDEKDWRYFGNVLNKNDLRHAQITGKAPLVPKHDVERLYQLARTWTLAHLKREGLPVL